jgi:hypothetical protein
MSGINSTLSKDQWAAQNRARAIVDWAKRRGAIQSPTDFECADCGNPATVYDHRDYNKPLDVVPVCQGCNVKRGPGKAVDPIRPVIHATGYVVDRAGVHPAYFHAMDFDADPVDARLTDLPSYVDELARHLEQKPMAAPGLPSPQLWTEWHMGCLGAETSLKTKE